MRGAVVAMVNCTRILKIDPDMAVFASTVFVRACFDRDRSKVHVHRCYISPLLLYTPPIPLVCRDTALPPSIRHS